MTTDPAFALERTIDQYRACRPTEKRIFMRKLVRDQGLACDARNELIRKIRRAEHILESRQRPSRATLSDGSIINGVKYPDREFEHYTVLLARYEAIQRFIDQAWVLIWEERIPDADPANDADHRHAEPLHPSPLVVEGAVLGSGAAVPNRRRRGSKPSGMELLPHLRLPEERGRVSGPDGMER